jgi:hypothetical protein
MFASNMRTHFRGRDEAGAALVAGEWILAAAVRHNAVPLDGRHQLVAIWAAVHPRNTAIGTHDLKIQIVRNCQQWKDICMNS